MTLYKQVDNKNRFSKSLIRTRSCTVRSGIGQVKQNNLNIMLFVKN